jgi:WD40 repeat protein
VRSLVDERAPSLFVSLPGKGGLISLLHKPSENSSNDKVIMTFKAHTRWISSAKFVLPYSCKSESLRVLSAADDGTIKFWDLCAVQISNGDDNDNHKSDPRLIMTSPNIHGKGKI